MILPRYLALLALLGSTTLASAFEAEERNLVETPTLEPLVKAGKLPPVLKRVPLDPAVADLTAEGKTIGRHGGEIRTLFGKPKDTRMITVYGYARLAGYGADFVIRPDILKDIEIDEGRIFTLHLRRGHRWSDGHPFTAEDFRYYWDDIANNKDLSPLGPPKQFKVDGKLPVFEVLSETAVRFTWTKPNRGFVPWLAGSRPPFIYRPAHYLKRFHVRYGNKSDIEKVAEKEGRRNWAELHFSRDRAYRADNPDYPTLQPWMNTIRPPAQRFVFVRNPYYHRVDTEGRQLPYVDRLIVTLGSVDVIPARTGSGESDLQARYIRFNNYTFLKKAEKRNNFKVLLWRTLKTSHKALYPNLNVKDKHWRKLLHDARFRRSLSLAINRHEINQVIYYGLAKSSNNTVFPESPLFKPEYRTKWAAFDLKRANALLDEIGLTKRDDEGTRLLDDGRPIHIIIDSAGESTEESDMLELIRDNWAKIGVKLYTRPSQREVFRNRVFSGKAVMSIWAGLANGISTAEMSPNHFAPTAKYQYQWSKWGRYFSKGGKKGKAPSIPEVKRLFELYKAWGTASTEAEQTRIWHDMLAIHADQVFTIGIVNGTLHPIVVSNRLQNVPDKGYYHWEPGAYFGIYRPDTFWMKPKKISSAESKAK